MAARRIDTLHLGKTLTARRVGRRWRAEYGGLYAEALFLSDALETLGVPGDVTQLSLNILALEAQAGEEESAAVVTPAEGASRLAARPTAEPD